MLLASLSFLPSARPFRSQLTSRPLSSLVLVLGSDPSSSVATFVAISMLEAEPRRRDGREEAAWRFEIWKEETKPRAHQNPSSSFWSHTVNKEVRALFPDQHEL